MANVKAKISFLFINVVLFIYINTKKMYFLSFELQQDYLNDWKSNFVSISHLHQNKFFIMKKKFSAVICFFGCSTYSPNVINLAQLS